MSAPSLLQRAFSSSKRNPLPAVDARRIRRTLQSQRLSRGAATLSFPDSNAPSPFDIQIFDIFDAPSRLGESSKLLRRDAAPSHVHSAARSIHSSAQSERVLRKIKPLPTPITYDGPARPKHMSMIAFRAPRVRSSSSQPFKQRDDSHVLPASLPPPIMFDGPSRLRRYSRNGHSSNNGGSSVSISQSALLLAGVGFALYSGSEYYTSKR